MARQARHLKSVSREATLTLGIERLGCPSIHQLQPIFAWLQEADLLQRSMGGAARLSGLTSTFPEAPPLQGQTRSKKLNSFRYSQGRLEPRTPENHHLEDASDRLWLGRDSSARKSLPYQVQIRPVVPGGAGVWERGRFGVHPWTETRS